MSSPEIQDFVSSCSQIASKAYHSLGALPDYADPLIAFTYDRQCFVDPAKTPRYLQNLKDIAAARHSELLEIKAVTLESQGHFPQQAMDAAYAHFGLSSLDDLDGTDDIILKQYYETIERGQAEEITVAKGHVQTLSHMRASQRLADAIAPDGMASTILQGKILTMTQL